MVTVFKIVYNTVINLLLGVVRQSPDGVG